MSEVDVVAADPSDERVRWCLERYAAEIAERFGWDPDTSLPLEDDDLRPPRGLMLLATREDEPLGCGGLKLHGEEPAEIKRVWVSEAARGLGLGRRLMADLEDHARALGATAVCLDSNAALVEAIALYRRLGYVEVPAFNDERHADHWFRKELGGE